MSAPKQSKAPKFPGKVYPREAAENPQWNPDNYPLWVEPKDWTEVRSETVAATATEAISMLKRANPANAARLRKSWVTEFNVTLKDGGFSLMDTVEFDINGFLINGEHRLRAIAASNAVVLLNVAYGRNPANYYKYDYNYGRTGGNIVNIWAYDESDAEIRLPKADGDSISSGASLCIYYWAVVALEHRLKITPTTRIKWIKENPKILPNLKTIRNYVDDAGITKKSEMPCAESILLALLTLGSDVNVTKTREFIRGVIMGTGDGWYTGSPIKVYREELVAGRHNTKGKGRMYNSYKFGMGLYALRQYLDDRNIDKTAHGYILRYKPGKEKSITRLSTKHEEEIAAYREQMREDQKNRLLVLLNPITPELTAISTLVEGKFFTKTAEKGLTKLGIVTIADILTFSEVGLRMVLKSKAIDEVKDILGALDLTLMKR